MGRKRINIVEKNKKYNMLTAIEPIGEKCGNILWKCICECGNETIVRSNNLVKLKTKSCGCIRRKNNAKHNMCKTRIYNIYEKMKSRCMQNKCNEYKYYGKRGIKICDEWKNDFMNFYIWSMENGYKDNLTIDRIDVNGNYEPKNCRWADMKTQQNNRRNNRKIYYNGIELNVSQWADILNVPVDRILMRLKHGWSIHDTLMKPKQ